LSAGAAASIISLALGCLRIKLLFLCIATGVLPRGPLGTEAELFIGWKPALFLIAYWGAFAN
jgi:hypothetical protein